MERASAALVERRYFDCERHCLEALELAHQQPDYERMARICLPLQEARRQKRDQAADSRRIFVVDDQLPAPDQLRAGCYLVKPPRVGLDGRMLREMCEKKDIPAIVITREPTTRTGFWPIVALGPITIRTRIGPPPAETRPTTKPRKKKATEPVEPAPVSAATAPSADDVLPPVEWFLAAAEVLGDAAIASVDPARPAYARVEDLLMRLGTVPDHEKLHQRLAEACMQALRDGPLGGKARADLLGEVEDLVLDVDDLEQDEEIN